MIFNTYRTFSNWNKTGLDQMFVYASDTVPIFTPMLLFSLFMITMLASYFSSKRLGADGDFAASFAVAGFITAIVALVLSLMPGMIHVSVTVITIIVAILGVLFLYFSKRR